MSRAQARFVTSAASLEQCPRADRPEIAVSGRSNVGKSSLLNRILGSRNLAQTSKSPGKTRLLNYFAPGPDLYLVDLPGYGFARVSKAEKAGWRSMVDRYLRGRESLCGVIQLVDARHPPTRDDRAMVAWLRSVQVPFILVLTKSDKLKNKDRKPNLRRAREVLELDSSTNVVYFSSSTGEGKREISRWVDRRIAAPRAEPRIRKSGAPDDSKKPSPDVREVTREKGRTELDREKKTERLFTPGPVEVPEAVRRAEARVLLHHRTPEFSEIFSRVTRSLGGLLRTENPVAVLASSGTGAMEAALVNVTGPEDSIVTVSAGKFGARWNELGVTYGCRTHTLDWEWGLPVDPEALGAEVERALPKAVFLTHSETSTGTISDLEALIRSVRSTAPNAVVVVDAITTIGSNELLSDAWDADVVIGGSQKGVMTPPGLSYLSVGPRALAAARANERPRYYFDLGKAVTSLEKGSTPFTPAISLICALDEALKHIEEEGLEACIARHARNASACRAAARAMGLSLFSKSPANCATVIEIPPGISDADLRGTLLEDHGIRIAGGQASLKGKIVRIGHLGHYELDDIMLVMVSLEAALRSLGHPVEEGVAKAAIEETAEIQS